MEQFTIEKVRLVSVEDKPQRRTSVHMLTSAEKDIAQYIKKEASTLMSQKEPEFDIDYHQFDSRKGATWHCIVGRNFGSFVTHGRFSPSSCDERELTHVRNQALHLLLSWPLRHPAL